MCNQLDLKQKLRLAAFEVFKNISRQGLLGGKNPYTIAGASLMLPAAILDPQLSYEQVAGVVNVTVGTIKSAVSELLPFKAKLLSKDLMAEASHKEDK